MNSCVWVGYVLRLTAEEIAALTPYELFALWEGERFRRYVKQNDMAELWTIPYLNTNRRKGAPAVKLEDIFGSGRFAGKSGTGEFTAEDWKQYKELFG